MLCSRGTFLHNEFMSVMMLACLNGNNVVHKGMPHKFYRGRICHAFHDRPGRVLIVTSTGRVWNVTCSGRVWID